MCFESDRSFFCVPLGAGVCDRHAVVWSLLRSFCRTVGGRRWAELRNLKWTWSAAHSNSWVSSLEWNRWVGLVAIALPSYTFKTSTRNSATLYYEKTKKNNCWGSSISIRCTRGAWQIGFYSAASCALLLVTMLNDYCYCIFCCMSFHGNFCGHPASCVQKKMILPAECQLE